MQKMAALVAGLRDIAEKCNPEYWSVWISTFFDFFLSI